MAKLNLDYYDSSTDEVYSDGDIEYELLQLAGQDEDNWYNDGRWPVIYHMSPLRQNILNWFPFKKDCSVLEIGAGCGALTGLFCEKASRVVAVELTKRRADVNFHRHKHYNNLEVVVCDFQSIPIEWKFDYVIINGVLEYASYMVESNDPYVDFLKKSVKHLEDNGRILLAIENRLGLKYFSGSKEDHTGKYFSGLNNYTSEEKVRTFSKQELIGIIEKAGLFPTKFYYPYPDYKFPAEIFTDTTISTMVPTVADYPLDMPRVKLFDENKVYQSLMQLNIMDKFANSYLVEISKTMEVSQTDLSYVKISANRNKKFRICTYVDNDKKFVYKKALNPMGCNHLIQMHEKNNQIYGNGNIKNISSEWDGQKIIFPYISEKSLEEVLLSEIRKGNFMGFLTEFERFRDKLYKDINLQNKQSTVEFQKIFGDMNPQQALRWVQDANIDLISGNIFITNGMYSVIDYEWHFSFKIPQEFVLWRMLMQLMNEYNLSAFMNKSYIYKLLEITAETESCFSNWEENFAKNYVGIKDLYYLSKDIIPIDIEKAALQYLNENSLESTVFYDLGEGFSDSNYERRKAEPTESGFVVTFSNEELKFAHKLRWDPLEGMASCINIQQIETDATVYEIIPINSEGYIEDKGYEFFTFDPQFELSGVFENASYLKVFFSCVVLDWTAGYQKKEEENNQYRRELDEHVLINQKLETELNSVRNKHSSVQERLDKELDQLNKAQTELKETRTELVLKKEELDRVLSELNKKQDELNFILTQMDERRLKTAVKVLLRGQIARRKADE